ncbi:MAG: hypothetical protein C4318_07215 [Acidimicrobiia bacterium]
MRRVIKVQDSQERGGLNLIWFTSVLGTHRRGRSDDEDGFSIVELLASLTVLAIGIVALLGTLVVAARAAGTQRG